MNKTEPVSFLLSQCNNILLKNNFVPFPDLSDKDWDKMLSIASIQGLLPVISQSLPDLIIEDEDVRMNIVQWYVIAQENAIQYQLRLSNMRDLSKLLASGHIDIMFMKGASLAQLYPQPEWRMFSDIDFYLFGRSEEGIKLMAENGIENSAYYHHHTQATMNGVLLENHYDFVERMNHDCDIILDDALKALAEKEGKNYKADFLGNDICNAYVMTPTMNAIFLMRHMSAHFVSETIPLRMLYDWALFLQKYARDVNWGVVTKLYEQSGMSKFACIIQNLLLTHLDFECGACPIMPCTEELTEKVWNSIIYPPKQDPYKKFCLKYYIFETKTFFANRWKHRIVYPDESYTRLFFMYVWSAIRKMLGIL